LLDDQSGASRDSEAIFVILRNLLGLGVSKRKTGKTLTIRRSAEGKSCFGAYIVGLKSWDSHLFQKRNGIVFVENDCVMRMNFAALQASSDCFSFVQSDFLSYGKLSFIVNDGLINSLSYRFQLRNSSICDLKGRN